MNAALVVEFGRIGSMIRGSSTNRFPRLKHFTAMTVRILWKALTGCYPLGYRRDVINNTLLFDKN